MAQYYIPTHGANLGKRVRLLSKRAQYGTAFAIGRATTSTANLNLRENFALAMVEVKWNQIINSDGSTNTANLAAWVNNMQAQKNNGFKIILSPGFHFQPTGRLSLLPNAANLKAKDSFGNLASNGKYDIFSSVTLLNEMFHYIDVLHAAFPLDDDSIDDIRLCNPASTNGELFRPDIVLSDSTTKHGYIVGGNWALASVPGSTVADFPAGMPVSPQDLTVWTPGDSTKTSMITANQKRSWLNWYISTDVFGCKLIEDKIDSLGYTGRYTPVCPGRGTSEAVRVSDTAAGNYLPGSSIAAQANSWDQSFCGYLNPGETGSKHGGFNDPAIFANPERHIAYCSSVGNELSAQGITDGDESFNLTDAATASWSSGRYMNLISLKSGLDLGGENPGAADSSAITAAYYNSTTGGIFPNIFDNYLASKRFNRFCFIAADQWNGANTTGTGTPLSAVIQPRIIIIRNGTPAVVS